MTTSTAERDSSPSPESKPNPGTRASGELRSSAIFIAAASSVAAGALHIAASQTHLEHVGLSRLFIAVGTVQLVLGAALLISPSRIVTAITVVGNAAALGAWITTRFVGVTWVAGLEIAESPQTADTVTAILAAQAVVAGVVALVGRSPANADGRTDGKANRATLQVMASTSVLVVVLALLGASRLGSHEHDQGESEPIAAVDDAWTVGATETEVADTERLIAETQEAVATFTSIEDAESKGFVRINQEHLLKVDLVFDEHQLEATAIESLVVGQRDGEDYIRGGMYLMDIGQKMKDVSRFGGPLMVWHSHGGFCFEPTGVIAAGPEAGGSCPEDSYWVDDPPMVHIYNEPQLDEGTLRTAEDCGTFAVMDLPFEESVPGCGPEVNDESAGHAHG